MMTTEEKHAADIWDLAGAKKAARETRMPDEGAALKQMHEAYFRLRELGWRQIIYCPKDGSVFWAIEAGCSVPLPCHYEGEWPNGRWWLHEANDLWPSRPVLWKPRNKEDE